MSIGLVPTSTLEILDRTPPDQALILLLRHAAREPLPPGLPGDDVRLTSDGRASAQALGARIGARLRTLHTSPVPRCVETARSLVEGADVEMLVVEDAHLGAPGVYVEDGTLAWSAWLRLGHAAVMAHLVAGDRLDGLAEPRGATSRLVEHLLTTAGGAPGVHVFVTHDALVAPAAAHLLGRRLEPDDWPDYLEALALVQGQSVTATYRRWQAIRRSTVDRDIPAQVREALARGRSAYVRADYGAAAAADQDALSTAEALGSDAGIVRAARLLGLAEYRNGRTERSAALLKRARALALEIGWEREELMACNHLGATLRKLGLLDEADDTFRGALDRASPHEHRDVRARLMGSYGAFLDDLGESQAAAEHYARFEELLQLLDDPARLANARGLVSRAARLRGDFATALSKAEDEQRLGKQAGHPTREGRGWMHIAQAHAAMGANDEAERAFAEAAALLERGEDVRTPIEIATARGRFCLSQGKIAEAYQQVELACRGLRELSAGEHEHAAKVGELAAQVAAAAGLHGESLWHLSRAIEHHLARFEPISDPRLKRLTRGRRKQLVDLASRLLREAGEVEREAVERDQIDDLVRRLVPEHEGLPVAVTLSVGEWRRRVREDARLRWGRLMPGTFALLSPESRADLVLSDLVYQGPVDDLGRSLGLIFASTERELRHVVGTRLDDRNGHKPGLKKLINALKPSSSSSATRGIRDELVRQGHRLSALDVLLVRAIRVDEKETAALVDLRNDIAHGNSLQLTRLDVDAVRRVMVFGERAVLPMVARLPKGDSMDSR